MQQVKTLAPTIIHVLKVVEQGCRRIQKDYQFRVNTCFWLQIIDNVCYGCLATSTLLQLTNKSGNDIVQSLAAETDGGYDISDKARTKAFDIDHQLVKGFSELNLFEIAIDSLRFKDLRPLLDFYGLQHHENSPIAAHWLYFNQPFTIGFGAAKSDLIMYADFLKNHFIPRMETWFPAE